MADITTVARPYAKAIFECALAAKNMQAWSEMINVLAEIASDSKTKDFIQNPLSTLAEHQELFFTVTNKVLSKNDEQTLKQVIALLANNKRLLALPEIALQFSELRASYEKTITVFVESFSPLTKNQEQNLSERLSARLKRQVTLNVSINKSLLGGAVIRAEDFVLDGSVRSKIDKLSTSLAA